LDTLPVARDSYGRLLARIAVEIRKHGAEPIFMTQAIQSIFRTDEERERLWMGEMDGGKAYVSEEQYPLILRQFNETMQEVGRKHDVHVIDLPSLIENDGSLFYDGMHFNERGARTTAEVIAQYFVDHGLLARARPSH
jgi:lysophospholipase L1-like esterase